MVVNPACDVLSIICNAPLETEIRWRSAMERGVLGATRDDDMTDRNDFEARLRELSEEVERRGRPVGDADDGGVGSAGDDARSQGELSAARELERKFREISEEIGGVMGSLVEQLKRKNALESANEKLFDALHGELRSYKEETIREAMQKPFLIDLVQLRDEIERVSGQLGQVAGGGEIERPRHNLENALHFIDEILARHSVEVMGGAEWFDARTRRAVGVRPVETEGESGRVLEVRRRGYLWRGKVLRPEDVIVGRRLAGCGSVGDASRGAGVRADQTEESP